MANLTIDMPDDLARKLAGIAAAQRKSVQQVAVERLRTMVEAEFEDRAGSRRAVMIAMKTPPHLTPEDVSELEAAIASGRLPIRADDLFPD